VVLLLLWAIGRYPWPHRLSREMQCSVGCLAEGPDQFIAGFIDAPWW
jgi:hypothetical protein